MAVSARLAPSPVPSSIAVATAIDIASGGESNPSVTPAMAASSAQASVGNGRAIATKAPFANAPARRTSAADVWPTPDAIAVRPAATPTTNAATDTIPQTADC